MFTIHSVINSYASWLFKSLLAGIEKIQCDNFMDAMHKYIKESLTRDVEEITSVVVDTAYHLH